MVEVDAASNPLTEIVATIEVDRLVPGLVHSSWLVPNLDGSDDCAGHVIDGQGDKGIFCQPERYPRFRIEWIRVVLQQSCLLRNSIRNEIWQTNLTGSDIVH